MVRQLSIFLILTISVLFSRAEIISKSAEPNWLYRTSPNFSKLPALKEISNGYYLDLVDRQVNIEKGEEYHHIIRHIVNESGVQNASEVSVSFDPAYQKILFHKIAVIRNGVLMNQLDISKIKVVQEETDANDFQYNGTKRAFITLSDIRKDDKIDFAYTLVGINPVFGKKFSDNYYFTTNVSVTNYYFTLISPKDRPLDIKYFNDANASKKYILGETRFYHWENPTLKVNESQKSVPVWFDNYPYFDVTEYKDWNEIINWGLTFFGNPPKKLSPALIAKIEDWKKIANGDTAIFIGLASNFVQDQIRYLGVEVGIYSHQPHDPSTIFDQRFGDCKDKAYLLTSILKYYGIRAYVALVNTVLREKVIAQLPGVFNFDHAIVAIDNDSSFQFVDATISYQRGISKNRFIPAYGYALVLKEGVKDFMKVNSGPIRKTTIHEKYYVKKKSKEPSLIKIETVYEGGSADENRANFAENSLSEIQKSYKEFYGRYYDSLELENELTFRDDSINNKFFTYESYNIQGIWQSDDKGNETMSLNAINFLNLLPDPTTAYKNAPLGISFPSDIDYKIELHMPKAWNFPHDDYSISNDAYEFSFVVENKDSLIILNYHFKTFKDYIDESSLVRYKDDYLKIQSRLSYTLTNFDNAINFKGKGVNEMADFSFSWLSLFCSIIVLAACFFIFRTFNKEQSINLEVIKTEQKIGGWLWVLGVGLIFTLIGNIVNIIFKGFYNSSYWKSVADVSGQDLRALICIDELLSFITLAFLVFIIYLFFKKRDIFPKMFIRYILTSFIGDIILGLSYSLYSLPASFSEKTSELGRALISITFYGIIWITYLLKSSRVKATFIKPYSVPNYLENLSMNQSRIEDDENLNS